MMFFDQINFLHNLEWGHQTTVGYLPKNPYNQKIANQIYIKIINKLNYFEITLKNSK